MTSLAEISGLNNRGEGVGRVLDGPDKGLVAFLPGTAPGDVVRYLVVERKTSYLRGKVVDLLREGPGRVPQVCPVADKCGGCAWQHLDYALQLDWKRKLVSESLARIAKMPDVAVRPCIPSRQVFGYRNKVEVPVSLENGKMVAGFYEPYTHKVVPQENCHLEHPLAREVILGLVEGIRRNKYSVYDEKTGKGLVRHLVARVAPGTGERLAVVVLNGRYLPREADFAKGLPESLPGLRGVVLNFNWDKTNIVLGERQKTIWGRPYIEDSMGNGELGYLRFRISARSFYQINTEQAAVLYQKALECAKIGGDDTVYDVYSGIGTITLFAAKRAGRAIGIEEVRPAVVDAKRNARLNGIDNVRFLEGKAERILPSMSRNGKKPGVVILDPPRGGADERTLTAISRLKPRAIVYVSCNPRTLARDLTVLHRHGWAVKLCQPLDMFPMTPHVECVVLMSRVKD